MELYRLATEEEIRDYKTVERILDTLPEDERDDFIDRVGDFAWAFGKEQSKKYNKIRKYLKKYGLTTKVLRNWYFTEAE